jgi:hypothetical protein
MRSVLPWLAAVLLAASACNAVVGFDPEAQPCNPRASTEEEKCLAGYVCENGKCKKSTTPADAGP